MWTAIYLEDLQRERRMAAEREMEGRSKVTMDEYLKGQQAAMRFGLMEDARGKYA